MGDFVECEASRSREDGSGVRPPFVGGIDHLIGSRAFPHAVRLLARSFITGYEISPRVGALFATQQRWLLSHIALAEHFRATLTGKPGLTRRGFVQHVLRHGISSRNTAHAFLDETLKYGVLRPADSGRADVVVPSPEVLSLLVGWYAGHFEALDLIDGGDRRARFLACPQPPLTVAQPIVTLALLSSPDVRVPGPLYTIFTWADAGGLLMDRLIAGVDPAAPNGQDKILTDVNAISHLAQAFGLSRPHASRKLSAAELIGGLGWTGRRGRSRIWISRGFYEEYAMAQARKLVILDAALAEASTLVDLAAGNCAPARGA